MAQHYQTYQYHEDRSPSQLQYEEYEEEDGMVPDMETTGHMKYVDGRCSCCPYGYHVDVDFLRYGENKSDGNYLTNLKKIKHNKRKLRKSMEMFLQQQEASGEMSAPPPDVVHSSEQFMSLVENEETAANKVLEQMDISINQSIDLLRSARNRQKVANMSKSSDSADDYDEELEGISPGSSYYQQHNSSYYQQQQQHHQQHLTYQQQIQQREQMQREQREREERYRTEAELMIHGAPPGHQLGKSESTSSLSSQSTFSSEQPASSMYSGSSTNHTKHTSYMHITSTQLATQMAAIFRDGSLQVEHPGDSTTITASQLKTIREQMGLSLARLRELEEQVKAIPVLQVRISVLKEEKRLLNLQLKAKNNKLNMRSIGVGDLDINDYPDAGRPSSRSPTPRSFEIGEFHSFKRYNGEVPARTRPEMRTVGVGDGNVFAFEQYQQQLQMVSGVGESSTKERELHTEQSTHVMEKEKEIHTLLLGTDAGRMDSLLQNRKRTERPKAPSRTIGVGDGNVFDPSSNVHVHEKETKTVIIGGKEKTNKSVRNVGLLCKASMRDVGVMYHYDFDKPQSRSVGVGINEGLFSTELVEADGSPAGPNSTTVIHNMLQQLNMAAFHTRNINIRAEDLRLVIDEKLRREVHSVGVQTRFSTQDKATSHCGYEKHSIGVGDDTLDVDIRPVVQTRSIGVDHRPSQHSRLVATEPVPTRDASTYMRQEFGMSKSTNTEKVVTYPATTNTDIVRTYDVQTDTDGKIFQALEVIKNTGVNTPRVDLRNSAVNTDEEEPTVTDEKGTTTHNLIQIHHKASNTDATRMRSTGVGDMDIDELPEYMQKPMTRNALVGTLPIPTRDKGVGFGRIEIKDLSPTLEEQETVTKSMSREVKTSSVRSPMTTGGSTVVTREYTSRGGYGSGGGGTSNTVVTREVSEGTRGTGGTTITREYSSPSSTTGSTVVTREYSSRGGYGSGGSGTSVTRDVSESISGEGGTTITREYSTPSSTSGSTVVTREYSSRGRYGAGYGGGMTSGSTMQSSETEDSSDGVIRTTEVETVNGVTTTKEYIIKNGIKIEVTGEYSQALEALELKQKQELEQKQQSFQFELSPSGNTQMKVIRTTETDYVGDRPVNKRSDVVQVQDEEMSRMMGGSHQSHQSAASSSSSSSNQRMEQQMEMTASSSSTSSSHREANMAEFLGTGAISGSSSSSSGRFFGRRGRLSPEKRSSTTTTSEMLGGGGVQTTTTKTSSTSPGGRLQGRTVTTRETRIERRAVGGDNSASAEQLKSIMKQPGTPTSERKGIKFAEGTVGGFELTEDMKKSCELYSNWLQNSTVATTRELNAALNVIQADWFKVSSHKLSVPDQVEDYLSSFNQISPHLLEHVVNMADANGNTALHYAVSHCSMEIVSLLLDTALVDVNKQNKAGYTSIMLASLANIQSEKDKSVIRQLFLRGDVNAKASQAGQTALMLAVSHGRVDMVKMLLESSADVNMQDEDGSTALMCACEHGHTDIVKILLSHPDCDPSISDNDGSSAMSIAMEAGHRDVGVLLYAHTNFRPGSSPVLTRASKRMSSASPIRSPKSPLSPRSTRSTRVTTTRIIRQ